MICNDLYNFLKFTFCDDLHKWCYKNYFKFRCSRNKMGGVKLYLDLMSQPARAIQIFCRASGIDENQGLKE